ncbi:hypothetical protein [Spirillospora sp. NPDC029432]|uniref:hypothetical protein n=1 Tax=Spirillospora sp. NPDC029432 TaxID=3154599 RepID=UPI0034571B07
MDALTELRADFADWEFSLHEGPHTWVAMRYPGREGTFVTRLVSHDAEELRVALTAVVRLDRPVGSSA